MKYFKNIQSLDDLKKQYRELLKKHHPDNGGDVEIMKEINVAFDALFQIWKTRTEMTTGETVTETADSIRSEFYTQCGWEGENHDWSRSLKEVAQIVRAYIKEQYPTYKFSVRTSYASMCQELHVEMKESPIEIYKGVDDLTDDDFTEAWRMCRYYWTLDSWTPEEGKKELSRIWQEQGDSFRILNDATKAVVADIDRFVQSYNFHDCDGMIDYFDVDFYYFGCLRNNGTDVKIVPKTPRLKKSAEASSIIKSAKTAASKDESGSCGTNATKSINDPVVCIDSNATENTAQPADDLDRAETINEPESRTSSGTESESGTGDMFATLAAAFIQKKTIKPQKSRPKTAKTDPAPAQEPTQEAEEAKAADHLEEWQPGYNAGDNGFSGEFMESIAAGRQYRKNEYIYFPVDRGDGVKYIYKIDDTRRREYYHSPDFIGAFVNGCCYAADTIRKAVYKKFTADMDHVLQDMIPDSKTAKEYFYRLEDSEIVRNRYEAREPSYYNAEARRLYIQGETVTINLYSSSRNGYNESQLLDYLKNPAGTLEEAAKDYINRYSGEIYAAWKEYDAKKAAYDAIAADQNHEAHAARLIVSAISDQKTVKITIKRGKTYKVEAGTVRRLAYDRYIDSWYIIGDRPDHNISAEEIATVTHGRTILYTA